MQNSSVSLLTAILTAIVVFFFTTAWVTVKAARNTLRAAKATVPNARKTFRSTIFGLVKVGFFAALLLFALIAWSTHDVRTADDQSPAPGPSASHR